MVEFRRSVRLADLPYGKTERAIEATDEECASVANRLGLEALLSLSATLHLTQAQGSPIIRVDGGLVAEIRQICTSMLEPFDGKLAEDFGTSFTTEQVPADIPPEVVVDAVGEDLPEPLVGGRIDLAELVVQYLSLALDPHPRKPNLPPITRSFGAPDTGPDSDGDGHADEDNPFAVLERLKRRP